MGARDFTPGGDARNTPVVVLLRVIGGRATRGSVGVLLRVNVGGACGSLCTGAEVKGGEARGVAVGAEVALVGVGGAGKAREEAGEEAEGTRGVDGEVRYAGGVGMTVRELRLVSVLPLGGLE